MQIGSDLLTISSADSLLNQQIRQGMTHSHRLTTKTNISFPLTKIIKGAMFSANLTHTDKNDDRFSRYNIKYGTTKHYISGDQYTQGHPDRETDALLHITHMFKPSSGFVVSNDCFFSFVQHHQKSALYLLHRIDSLQQLPFGTLPSVLEYERAMDIGNSYDSHSRDISYAINSYFHHIANSPKGKIDLSISPFFCLLNQHLNYQRGTVDTTIVHKSLLLESLYCNAEWSSSNQMRSVSIAYSLKGNTPDLINFVNIHDTTDPMNLQEGNDNLRNTFTHSAELAYRYNNKDKQTSYSSELTYNYIQNALSKGYNYDQTTGVRTWKPFNVDGNWNIRFKSQYDGPLDKKKRLMFRAYTSLDYYASADMINGQRSLVNTFAIHQLFRMNWKIGQHTLGMTFDATSYNARSPREDFDNLYAFTFNNGVTALLKLPWKIELSTDFSAYIRTRYNDPNMNGTEWIWNARLIRPFLKGRLLFALDGYDLLGQRSNITRVINAQGRTETYMNSLPKYVLLNMIYRFNKYPQKNNKVE